MSVADMEPGDFTIVRLLSGTLMLILLGSVKQKSWRNKEGSWPGAFCLFIYAAAFSFAISGNDNWHGGFAPVWSGSDYHAAGQLFSR